MFHLEPASVASECWAEGRKLRICAADVDIGSLVSVRMPILTLPHVLEHMLS